MPPTSKKPRQWLLTVVSAGALLPAGCAQEPDPDGDRSGAVDEDERVVDAGVVAAPDAGAPTTDAGRVGVVVNPQTSDGGLIAIGVTAGPPPGIHVLPDAGVHVVPDAGPPDAGPQDAAVGDAGAKDAGKDAACPVLINGIIIAPPDSGCMPFYPGVMPRNVDGD